MSAELTGFEVDPRAASYYDRLTVERAIEYAEEHIAEWDYEQDPHGYCHTRPMLVRLVEGAKAASGEPDE